MVLYDVANMLFEYVLVLFFVLSEDGVYVYDGELILMMRGVFVFIVYLSAIRAAAAASTDEKTFTNAAKMVLLDVMCVKISDDDVMVLVFRCRIDVVVLVNV